MISLDVSRSRRSWGKHTVYGVKRTNEEVDEMIQSQIVQGRL